MRPEEIKPAAAQPNSQPPHRLAFRWVRESYTYLQPLLGADAANGGKKKKRDIDGFAKVAKPIGIDRLSKGLYASCQPLVESVDRGRKACARRVDGR